METDAETHRLSSRGLVKEWGIEVSKSEGSRTPQKRPTEATNLEPLGLTEPGSIRSWTWIPYTSVANMQVHREHQKHHSDDPPD